MHEVLRPLELMLLGLAGVITEREHVINLYLREENRILREQCSSSGLPGASCCLGNRTSLLVDRLEVSGSFLGYVVPGP